MSRIELNKALDHIKSGGFQIGADLDVAHNICQSSEGQVSYDWIHAHIHRIEGDVTNANYWYQRAGKTRHNGTIEEEWEFIHKAIN